MDEVTSLTKGYLLNMRAQNKLYCHAVLGTNKQSMANKQNHVRVSHKIAEMT
jgi:hypothetical protein